MYKRIERKQHNFADHREGANELLLKRHTYFPPERAAINVRSLVINEKQSPWSLPYEGKCLRHMDTAEHALGFGIGMCTLPLGIYWILSAQCSQLTNPQKAKINQIKK